MEQSPATPASKEKDPHIARYSSWDEFFAPNLSDNPPKHPEDIEVAGIKLSTIEKNNIQQQSVALAKEALEQHVAKLGITGRSLDERRITFVDYYSVMEAGAWYQRLDWIILPAYNEGNVGTLIHESVHALASQWQYRAAEYLASLPKGSVIKTGFASARPRQKERQVFEVLTEAVTEKIARALNDANAEEIERINKESNRKAYYLDEIEETKRKRVQEAQQKAAQKIQELADTLPENIERIKQEHKESAEEAMRKWIEAGLPQEFIDEFAKDEQGWLERDIQLEQKLIEMQSRFENSFVEMESSKWDAIKKGVEETMNNPITRDSYNSAIKMLDLLLDGIAKAEVQNSGADENTVRERLWTEMQRAYFEGDVMWLRKIERVFGEGALEAVATVPHPSMEMFTAEGKKKRSEEVNELLEQAVAEINKKSSS